MEFIGSNRKTDDCMIVALHNAAVAAGIKCTYEKVMKLALKKKWYKPGQGFKCDYLDKAMEALGLNGKLLPDTSTKKVYSSVVNKNKIYMFFCPNDWGMPGHAMVATKGSIGVVLHNSVWSESGWRTFSRAINSGYLKVYTIEVTRSA